MRRAELRAYTPALILTLGCLLLLHGTQKQVSLPPTGPMSSILPHVDGYSTLDQTVPLAERKVSGVNHYVARAYLRPDSTVAFETYVGYYDRQTQGKSIHSPKNCLPGAGWEILRAETATIVGAGGPQVVNRDVLKNGPQEAVVYYWYQGRGRVVASEYTVKWNLLRDAALTGHTEETLVRLVVPVGGPDSTEALAEQLGMRIAPRLMNAVQRILPAADASAPAVASAASGAQARVARAGIGL